MTVHGGDIWHLGVPPEELLDFSANVNPRGLPPQALERLARDANNPKLLRTYPDPTALGLRTALGRYLGVPPEAIAIGPGAEALMSPALRSMGARRALAPVPAFSEYRRVCEGQGVEFVPFPLPRPDCFRLPVEELCGRLASERFDVVFVNNPHNPSGALLEAAEVRRIADTGTTVLLDEAFIDYTPQQTFTAEAASHWNVIALRSLTKFYGCPALRVGYAVSHPDTIRKMANLLPTWPVTQMAMDALACALDDCEYAAATLRENATQRKALRSQLEALGLAVLPSAANYLLCELQPHMPPAAQMRSRLVEHHRILIRNCDSYEGLTPGRYVRVAVLAEPENRRLVEALAMELNL